ncbi:MAG: RsmD family RNA methyltransferase [Lewinellaceae bacterium]|nr:RsmD family RNA methyltransferase [Lewinellaceae bacterium]
MRIISGEFKGRRFYPPADNWPTRPTTDFAKEGLFNILTNLIDFEETRMLDLFGGTGNHCFEFISRGCPHATYVDAFPAAVIFVKKTAQTLGIEEKLTVIKNDVFKFLKNNDQKFDYIFAGPPYPLKNLNEIPDIIFSSDVLENSGIFILEHNPKHNFEEHPQFWQSRNYGTTIFSFFRD